jgi:hypothetical protein
MSPTSREVSSARSNPFGFLFMTAIPKRSFGMLLRSLRAIQKPAGELDR